MPAGARAKVRAGISLVATLLAWLLVPATAHALPGAFRQNLTTCIAPRAERMTPRALFAHPGRFDCDPDQIRWGSGDFDVLSVPLAPGTGLSTPLTVRTASLWQDGVTLYVLYADGAIVDIATDGHVATRHLQLGAIVERALPVRGVPIVRLLWRTRGSANLRGVLNGPALADHAQSTRSNTVIGALYAGFAGLCIALLVFNLALWAALRHRFQLAYCAMVTTLLVYSISSSGALAWLMPGIVNNDRLRVNYVALALAGASAMAFARSFFEERVFRGWLGTLSRAVSGMLIVSAALFVCLAPFAARLLDRLYALSFATMMLTVIPVLWRAWRVRSNYLWLFTIGWAAPIGMATLRVAGNFDLLPWSFWLDNSTILAMTLEAVLSSLAIAYRIHLLSRERDEAREQEIAARLLAATDPLTGLLNRRAFLERAIGREGDQMLLLADIDHFKRVNETIGHDGGDEVLRVFARALRTAVPPETLVARIGGEEFAIIAPAERGLSATVVLDRLRAERMPFDLTVTASIGTCVGPLAREADWKTLYCSADRALFEAKAAGRDRARDAGHFVLAA